MKIHTIVGSMFAGKTTQVFREEDINTRSGKTIIKVKPLIDNRYGTENEIVSHNNLRTPCIVTTNLLDLVIPECDILIIDEGHLFKDLYEFITSIETRDIVVIVTGLLTTYKKGVFFDDMLKVVAISDKITHLKSICYNCKKYKGIFSHNISATSNIIDVGSCDKYIPLCRTCFNKLN